jgi:hypothetical protein
MSRFVYFRPYHKLLKFSSQVPSVSSSEVKTSSKTKKGVLITPEAIIPGTTWVLHLSPGSVVERVIFRG